MARIGAVERRATPLKPRWNTPFDDGSAPNVGKRRDGLSRLPRCGVRPAFGVWFARFGVLICAALAVLTTRTRHACAAAGQWQAGGRVGVAWLDGPRFGPSAEAYLRRGIGDALDLDLQLLTSLHPFQPDTKMPPGSSNEPSALPWALGITPGLLYRWDVLRAIPYAGVGLGVYTGEGLSSRWNGTQFGAVARAGVEWLLNRDVVLSAQTSAHFGLSERPVPAPWVQLTVGAGYVWGW